MRRWLAQLLVLTATWGAACVVPHKPDARIVEGRAAHGPVIAIVRSADNDMARALGQAFVDNTQARVVIFTVRRNESTKALALGVRAEHANLVFAIGADALVFAQKRLPDLPVVFAMVAAPQEKIVRPEQVAGVAIELEPSSEFAMYRLLLPRMRTVLVFHGSETSGDKLDRARRELVKTGIALKTIEVSDPRKIARQFDAEIGAVDAVWLVPDASTLNVQTFSALRDRALKAGKPLLCSALEHFVRDGALMAVTPDAANVAAQVATMAAEILSKRRTPGELGVVAPLGGGLVVNSGTAQHIGVAISDDIRFLIRTFYDDAPETANTPPSPGGGG